MTVAPEYLAVGCTFLTNAHTQWSEVTVHHIGVTTAWPPNKKTPGGLAALIPTWKNGHVKSLTKRNPPIRFVDDDLLAGLRLSEYEWSSASRRSLTSKRSSSIPARMGVRWGCWLALPRVRVCFARPMGGLCPGRSATARRSMGEVQGFRDWLIDGYLFISLSPPLHGRFRVVGMLEARARFNDTIPEV